MLYSHCVTYNTEWASSLSLDELSCHLLSVDQLPPFYSLYFFSHEISASSFNVKIFASIISSGTYSSFLSQWLSSVMLSSPSISSSGYISRVSQMAAVSTFSPSAISSIYIWFKCYFQDYLNLFLCYTYFIFISFHLFLKVQKLCYYTWQECGDLGTCKLFLW